MSDVFVKCKICDKGFYVSSSKAERNKHFFCSNVCYHSFLSSDENPHKGVKRQLSTEAREKMHESAVKNLQNKEAQRKSAEARKGLKLSEKHKQKIREHAPRGEDNKTFCKDETKISYQAIHMWVYRYKGKATVCDNCGAINGTISNDGKKIRVQWSNIDHKYRRRLEDYTARCEKCHDEYDTSHGLKDSEGRARNFFAKFSKRVRFFKKLRDRAKTFVMDGIIVDGQSPSLSV